MILWPAPSTRAKPARTEPLPVQSIKQPQLDLHSRLHNPGTYRVKAPGRSPSHGRGGRSRQMSPITTDHPPATDDRARRSNVKSKLTPNRRRRAVENDEYASFTRRVIRAYARRVAAGDVDALAAMTAMATELDEAISQAVIGLRKAGYSWAEIAVRLGVTRQAAQHSNDGAAVSDPFKRPALGTIWGPHATHAAGQSACDRTSRYTHTTRLSCEDAYPTLLGVKGSRVQIPPSRLFFERFFAMYSSSTAVSEEEDSEGLHAATEWPPCGRRIQDHDVGPGGICVPGVTRRSP